MLLGTLNEKVVEVSDISLWDGKCTQALNAFSLTVSYIVSKYGKRAELCVKQLCDLSNLRLNFLSVLEYICYLAV